MTGSSPLVALTLLLVFGARPFSFPSLRSLEREGRRSKIKAAGEKAVGAAVSARGLLSEA